MMDPGKWEFSSYRDIIRETPTFIYRDAVLNWFGGREKFIKYHQYMNLLGN
jgi:hypothetical protein